jgi:hypothetical protein
VGRTAVFVARDALGGCSHAILCSENSGMLYSQFVAACTTMDSTGLPGMREGEFTRSSSLVPALGGALSRPRQAARLRSTWKMSYFLGSSGTREPNRKNRGSSVPKNQEPDRNRIFRFWFFRFRFPVLSVRFPVLLPRASRQDPAPHLAGSSLRRGIDLWA